MTIATRYPLTNLDQELGAVTLPPKAGDKTAPTPPTLPTDCVAFETPTTQYLGITQYDPVTKQTQMICLDERQISSLIRWLGEVGCVLGAE